MHAEVKPWCVLQRIEAHVFLQDLKRYPFCVCNFIGIGYHLHRFIHEPKEHRNVLVFGAALLGVLRTVHKAADSFQVAGEAELFLQSSFSGLLG